MRRPRDFSWTIGPFIIIFIMAFGAAAVVCQGCPQNLVEQHNVSICLYLPPQVKSSCKAVRSPSPNFRSSQKNKGPIVSGIACGEFAWNKNTAQVWILKQALKPLSFMHLKHWPLHPVVCAQGGNRWAWASHQVRIRKQSALRKDSSLPYSWNLRGFHPRREQLAGWRSRRQHPDPQRESSNWWMKPVREWRARSRGGKMGGRF